MNKNNIIAALAVLALIGSIWGSLMGSQRSGLKKQLVEKDNIIAELQEQQSSLAVQADKGKELESTLSGQATEFKAAQDELAQLKSQGNQQTADLEKALQAAQKELVVRQEALEAAKKELVAAQTVSAGASAENQNKLATTKNELAESQKALLAAQNDLATVAKDRDRNLSNLTARDEKLNQLRVEVKHLKKKVEEQSGQAHELKKSQAKAAELEINFDETSQALKVSQKQFEQLLVNKNVLLSKISEQNTSLEHYAKEVRDLKKQLAAVSPQK